MLKQTLTLLTFVVTAIILTACQTATIVDLVHPQTDKALITDEELQNTEYENFKVGEVLFLPYTRHNGSVREGEETFTVMLSAYQPKDHGAEVTVNTITIFASEDVNFEKIDQLPLSIPLEFQEEEEYPGILRSNTILLEQMNNDNLNLNEESTFTMVLNVSVTSEGETTTKDIAYEFNTNIRKYAVQR